MSSKAVDTAQATRPAQAINRAGGLAYEMEARHALAQLAATGTLRGAYYNTPESLLDDVKRYAALVSEAYLAKLAVYAREQSAMKDMPAVLLVLLAARNAELFHQAFDRVVDNGRVLRTLFRLVRTGSLGKRSLSSAMQRAFQRWLNGASTGQLLSASIGSDPTLRDVLRLARPTPKDNERRALFGWLTDKPVEKWTPATRDDLPRQVKLLELFRAADSDEEQVALLDDLHARWDLLADSAKGPLVWAQLARNMGPQALRMNLNTLLRHQVFKSAAMIDFVAARLGDRDEILKSRQMPYQYFTAALNVVATTPAKIQRALAQAAEIACDNAPVFNEPVVVGVDVSGSMGSSVTGYQAGRSSKVRCVDVAALFAAAVLRKNPESVVVPFDTRPYRVSLSANESITTLAQRLAAYGGGGTDCSIAIKYANTEFVNRKFAGVVLVSDNESWVGVGRHGETGVMTAWRGFVANQLRLKGADSAPPKLVCIDLAPGTTTQAAEQPDVLNVGGFSDAVFEHVADFINDADDAAFVNAVEAVEL